MTVVSPASPSCQPADQFASVPSGSLHSGWKAGPYDSYESAIFVGHVAGGRVRPLTQRNPAAG